MDAVYEELIEKVGKDDSQAFAELYHATDRAVYGFALSIIKNKQDAEDIMHDTYPVSYTHLDVYKRQFMDNVFYTTGVNRMTRGILEGCVVIGDVEHVE